MSLSQEMRTRMCLILTITLGDVVRGQTGLNAVALVKGETMLDCVVNSWAITQWTRTSDGSSNSLSIASGCLVNGNNSAYYRTEQPGGNICRLIIANATMQLAGVYTCFDGTANIYRSLVTVIDPVASVIVYNRSEVVVDDQLNISCSINYNGPTSPAPSLRPVPYWTTSPEQIFTAATYHPSTNVATSLANVTVQKPTVPIFQCNTVFEITGNTTGYNATLPPDNLAVGATIQMEVQYPPSKPGIVTMPSGFVACEAKNLTCNSEANPPPNFRWVDITSGNATNAQEIIAECGFNYTCSASNIIRNVVYFNSSTYYAALIPNKTCQFPRATNMGISGQFCKEDYCECDCNSAIIRCSVDAYPEPSYEWITPDGSRVQGETVEATMNGIFVCRSYTLIDGWYLVEAYKSINISGCSNSPITTTHSTENTLQSNCSSTETAAIVLGVLLAISITAHIFSFVLFYRKGAVKQKDSSEPEVTQPTSHSQEPRYQDLSHETWAKPEYEELHH